MKFNCFFLSSLLCCLSAQAHDYVAGMGIKSQSQSYVNDPETTQWIGYFAYEHERWKIDTSDGVTFTFLDKNDWTWAINADIRSPEQTFSDDDTEAAVDLGLVVDYGIANISVFGDVSDTYNGYEVDLELGYPMHGKRWMLKPLIGAEYKDKALVLYDYAPNQHAQYASEQAVTPIASITGIYAPSKHIRLIGALKYEFFDNVIVNSPVVKNTEHASGFVLLAYMF